MLNLEKPIKLFRGIESMPNLVDRFTEDDLCQISDKVYSDYLHDCQSREKWVERNQAALDLAMQVQHDKNFPWPGCSNIAFPLVTIAALQFHSRAYPALVTAPDLVQFRVIGDDPEGIKIKRAERVQTHMNWQILEEDCCWEEDMDRALLVVPILGHAWKKTYYNGATKRNVSELVLPTDLIINYWAKKGGEGFTKTHKVPLTHNQIISRISRGLFADVAMDDWFTEDAPDPKAARSDAASAEQDNRAGLTPTQPDSRTPFICLEQHCYLDLDGDGYSEPYIVTMEESSKCILRIVARWDRPSDVEYGLHGRIIHIKEYEYFTKIPFIPNPDGSVMDIGFGVLLGPLNESVNTAINQLFDAGTMNNTAGGFLGRGAKIRGGVYNFSPFSWNRVDSSGDDLRKSLIPLPVREPSTVIYNLLNVLIDYTQRISGAVDINVGQNPGQNTPATTTNTMVEQGQKVYAAIFKRIWLSVKKEFQKWYQLNALFLPPSNIMFAGTVGAISKSDYLGDPSAICPSADPNIMSDQQRFTQAQFITGLARGNPLFNQDEVFLNVLRAAKIPNIGQMFLGRARMQPLAPPEKIQVETMKAQVQLQNLQFKKLQYISSLLEQRRLNEAKIIDLYAQAALAEKQAGGVESANQIKAFQSVIDALKTLNQNISSQVGELQNDQQVAGGLNSGTGNVPGMGQEPGYPESSGMGQATTGAPEGAVGPGNV